jgi:hypothetical protein
LTDSPFKPLQKPKNKEEPKDENQQIEEKNDEAY